MLTITEMLRKHGVVSKFVEFYGTGVTAVPLANRATIGNMSPEFGSTAAIFPIDAETLTYLKLTGRSEQQIALVEAYAKEQGLWHDPSIEPVYSEYLELDLSTIVPSIAGPKRPQDRVSLSDAKAKFRNVLPDYASFESVRGELDEAVAESFPASDAPAVATTPTVTSRRTAPSPAAEGRPSKPTRVVMEDGTETSTRPRRGRDRLDHLLHQHVEPAGHARCGAAREEGGRARPDRKPWVKTTLAPGSKVVMDYYEKAGLIPYLEKLGFHLVGYGCTTCIGNSGPLPEPVSAAVNEADLAVVSVLSGNRNFEGRINPDVKMNYLASPPLVVAYAIAGTMDLDLTTEPLGTDSDGKPVYLDDIWPSAPGDPGHHRHRDLAPRCSARTTRTSSPATSAGRACPPRPATRSSGPLTRPTCGSPRTSTACRPSRPRSPTSPTPGCWPSSATRSPPTTSPRPARSRPTPPPARYLAEHGVARKDFNSYGSRRGNHEVMIRGTFANIRLRNQLVPGVEGGFTRNFLADGEQTTIYDASQAYQAAGIPLVILSGKEYGSGSSRDWAAKGTALLGARAVIAESYERIHRSNLIGMGVLPLQYPEGQNAESLGLTGEETFSISGITALNDGGIPRTVKVSTETGVEFDAIVRIDTPGEADYYRHGGIMQYVLRSLLTS